MWRVKIDQKKYQYCPECNKKLEIEETFFGFFLQCNKCGLGLGCNEKGEIVNQSKTEFPEICYPSQCRASGYCTHVETKTLEPDKDILLNEHHKKVRS